MEHVSDILIYKDGTSGRRHAGTVCVPICCFIRGFCRNTGRRGGGWVCPVTDCQKHRADFVDSGSDVAPRNRTAASWRNGGPLHSAAGRGTPRRCAGGGGRGFALQGIGRCGGRDLGQPTHAELHRHQTSGLAGRGCGSALLADPSCRHRRSECGARPLAHSIAAVCPQPRRHHGPRRSALAGGAVSVARQATRPVDCAP